MRKELVAGPPPDAQPGAAAATPPRPPAAGPARPRRRSRGDWSGYLFMVPWLVGLVSFTAGPLVISLYLSFTNYDLFTSPQWTGLANFRRMFTEDPRYWHAVRVTAIYTVTSVPAKLGLALAVALLLNRARRGVGIYRSLLYVPSLLGASVAIALVWRGMFDAGGAVDQALSLAGIHMGSWIYQPDTALWTLVALVAWQFGAPMVIFLAGLKQIPGELYDAAAVDGASKVRQFWHVTVPMLSPVIFFNLLLEIIQAFQSFTPASIISGGTGGPADSTLVYTLYLYQKGFGDFEMGYASAMAWVLLAAVGAVTLVLFATARLWVFYGGED
ncbi:MAG: pectin-derived oligosaccharide transport system permease protein [Cryptosporangiaceae bacterium]|nr:pectin-derived oligosaccharide transport system permease protein [Cryptosporangiaceae bacterium]